VNDDDDEGKCRPDQEGGGNSLSNRKVSDGSGTEDSGSGADRFTPSEEWLRELKITLPLETIMIAIGIRKYQPNQYTSQWFTAFLC